MTSIVDDRGQLHLPEEVANQLGLRPGDRVIVETGNGQCIIRPADGGLRWEGNVLVHHGVGVSLNDVRDERLRRLSEGLSG